MTPVTCPDSSGWVMPTSTCRPPTAANRRAVAQQQHKSGVALAHNVTNQPTKDKMPIDQAYAKPRTMRRTAALAAIAVAALAGAWARRDYLAWLALGEGGLPANPKGWLITSYLRLRKADPIATAVYDAQIHTPGAAAHLGPLPGRRGPRPRIAAWPIPHRQLDQFPGPEMRTALERVFDDALRTHAGPVHSKLSHFEKRNSAVTLRDPVAGHPDARLSEGETAHIHPYDGSMHMIFSAADATSVLDAGWGERHPLAGVLPELPSTYIYVYPPRDGAELAIVAQLLNAAIEHMTSTGTDQSGDRQHRPPKAPTTPRRTHLRGAPPPTPGQRHE